MPTLSWIDTKDTSTKLDAITRNVPKERKLLKRNPIRPIIKLAKFAVCRLKRAKQKTNPDPKIGWSAFLSWEEGCVGEGGFGAAWLPHQLLLNKPILPAEEIQRLLQCCKRFGSLAKVVVIRTHKSTRDGSQFSIFFRLPFLQTYICFASSTIESNYVCKASPPLHFTKCRPTIFFYFLFNIQIEGEFWETWTH